MKYPPHLKVASIALASAAVAAPVLAQSETPAPAPATATPARSESPGARAHATLSLISATKAWQPGSTLLLAFNLDIEDGWHTYWRGVSDTGQPPEFELTLPDGFVAGEWIWPAPRREIIKAVNALDHIYEHRLTVVVPVQTPAAGTKEAEAASAHFAASGVWLVCKSACVPEKGEAVLDLPRGEPTPDKDHTPWIEETAAQKPIPLAELKNQKVERFGGSPDRNKYLLVISGATEMIFFPDKGCIAMPRLFEEGRTQTPKLELTLAPEDDPTATRVKGLLKVWGLGDKPAYVQIDNDGSAIRKHDNEPDLVK